MEHICGDTVPLKLASHKFSKKIHNDQNLFEYNFFFFLYLDKASLKVFSIHITICTATMVYFTNNCEKAVPKLTTF
jgi:hypothetical protein